LTGPPPSSAGGPPATPPASAPAAPPAARRPRSPSAPQARTTGRHELARHARFAELSPETGVLDEQAARQALAADPAAFELLAAMTRATDEKLRAAALRLAAAIVLDRARSGRRTTRGTARLRPAPGADGGDLDLDASLEAIAAARAAARPLTPGDLVTLRWTTPATAFAVVVDRSGSMTGARLAAAATVAAACALRAPAEHAVLSFAATVDVIRPLVSDLPPAAVAAALLGLRGHGTTALSAALAAAAAQLAAARAQRQVVILLSDCRATDDDEAAPAAARALPELIILAPADDHDHAARLAAASGARWSPLTAPLDAAALLDTLLAA
jgi:Mg-chelatase subunit ChlD